jgi:hypothetical protein
MQFFTVKTSSFIFFVTLQYCTKMLVNNAGFWW